jgi:hypothetical protein
MEREYILLIDTLNLLILPVKEIGISYLSSVQSQIDELEGDYHTFLHKDNILKLVSSGSVSRDVMDTFEQIRTQISEIESSLWNPLDFINNIKWQQIRNVVLILFEKEMMA